jgi:glycosyltransferase involved in cell wall biosynthesis
VNPRDVEAIAEKTNYLLQNPELAAEMGRNGRKAVLEKFNWCNEEKKLFDVYKNVIK